MIRELVPPSKAKAAFRDTLARPAVLAQLQTAAASGIDAKLVARILMSEVTKAPKLLKCTQESLFGAAITCLQLGLMPDSASGEAYLVPFGTTATLIVGYRGMIQLASRSGLVGAINARVVHVQDQNSLDWGRTPKIEHIPTRDPTTPEDVVAAYAIIEIRGGGETIAWMFRHEIDAVRAGSPSGNRGPWVTHFEAMATKTVLRRALKLCPSSRELQRAITLDDEADSGLPQHLDAIDLGEPDDVPADAPADAPDDAKPDDVKDSN